MLKKCPGIKNNTDSTDVTEYDFMFLWVAVINFKFSIIMTIKVKLYAIFVKRQKKGRRNFLAGIVHKIHSRWNRWIFLLDFPCHIIANLLLLS
jgi:hypothetical protein